MKPSRGVIGVAGLHLLKLVLSRTVTTLAVEPLTGESSGRVGILCASLVVGLGGGSEEWLRPPKGFSEECE